MILIKDIALVILGLSCGFSVAAGIFAFITMLGIIPRLAARTNTAKYIYMYEWMIILGGTLGNLWELFQVHVPLSIVLVCAYGVFSGIFVGCLVMALAEMLRVIPIMVNRIQIKEGFPLIATAIALGKMTGTLFQFFF